MSPSSTANPAARKEESMNSAIERLLRLSVKDAMAKEVVVIAAHATMGDAAETLSNSDISGAPVVDEQGHCVGIISAADFVQRETSREEESEHELTQESPARPYRVRVVADDLVSTHMTGAVQSIDADASLTDAGRVMCAGHVHRLPVLDEAGHVVGMVSSLDLVAATIQAIEE
jgi:CBS-domain-containing membrane protein